MLLNHFELRNTPHTQRTHTAETETETETVETIKPMYESKLNPFAMVFSFSVIPFNTPTW